MRVINGNDSLRMCADRIWYLYGFHARETEKPFDVDGLDNRYPVQAFCHAGLTAYVSRVAWREFSGEQAEARLQDIAWVTYKARVHQQVLDALMHCGSLFPVSFGTVFSSLDKLAGVMESKQQWISETLQRLNGCREWGIQIGMDKPAVIAARITELARQQPRPAADSPGLKHLQQQRFKRQVVRDMDNWLNRWQMQLLLELKPLSAGFCDRKRLLLEGLVCNWAFLVPDDGQAVFFERVGHWRERAGVYGLQVSIKGPWAPYSFCSGIA